MFDLRAGILLTGTTCVFCGMTRERCGCGSHEPSRRMPDALRAF